MDAILLPHTPMPEVGIGGALDPGLAPREAQTLLYIAQGCTTLQAAHRMGVSTHTVNTYLRRIRAKFDVTSRADLTQLAVALNIIGVPTAGTAHSITGVFRDHSHPASASLH